MTTVLQVLFVVSLWTCIDSQSLSAEDTLCNPNTEKNRCHCVDEWFDVVIERCIPCHVVCRSGVYDEWCQSQCPVFASSIHSTQKASSTTTTSTVPTSITIATPIQTADAAAAAKSGLQNEAPSTLASDDVDTVLAAVNQLTWWLGITVVLCIVILITLGVVIVSVMRACRRDRENDAPNGLTTKSKDSQRFV